MSFEPNIFVNKIQRVPTPKMQEMFRKHEKEIKSLTYNDINTLFNYAEKRIRALKNVPQNEIMLSMMLLSDLSRPVILTRHNIEILKSAEKELKSLDIVPLIESLAYVEYDKIQKVLNNYHSSLPSQTIETLIINLPENRQIKAIEMCKNELMKSENISFLNFMASISQNAQKYVIENFGDKFSNFTEEEARMLPGYLYQDNIQLYTNKYQELIQKEENLYQIIMSCEEKNLREILSQYKEQLKDLNADELMQILCYKISDPKELFNIWIEMPDKIKEVSTANFKIFIKRLENEKRLNSIYDFKEKYAQMDIEDIIELFENDTDDIKARILVQYRDRFSGEESDRLKKIMTKTIRDKMIDIYSDEILQNYEKQIEEGVDLKNELNNIVNNLKVDGDNKLFDDDYLKAILLSRILLKRKIINDKNDSYIRLGEKYLKHLYNKLDRDNTTNQLISNSLFYRIVKGNIDFKSINSDLKSVKALLYLYRNPKEKDIEKIEDLVNNLSEKQVESYNIKFYKKLCGDIKEKYKDSQPLEENIQKLAYKLFFFCGYDKAKKILENDIGFTTFEYIFNDLEIKKIELNKDGTPKMNKKLSNFLFGHGKDEKDTNINKLLNDKARNSYKYISGIYNDWDTIYEKLHGNITLKRVLDSFKSNDLKLKPNEYKLLDPMQEIGTNNKQIVEEAKKWYKTMREKQYSSIPKVKGNLGHEYSYEILDLDDPTALAVGYITRCCFLINGLSRQSLYHSISSKNGRTFVVKKNGELIAQSWIWRNGNVLCFDNVETRGNYSYDTLLEVYKKASNELIEISNKSEDEKESLKLITYGTSESKMSRPEKVLELTPLPSVLENVNYSDAKREQCVLAEKEYKDLYYGEVSAKYRDPRPKIIELKGNQIKSLDVDHIYELDELLDSIKYESTGSLRDGSIEDYQYIICNKDWYITINKKGQVDIQLLKRDERAIEECKEKAKFILENVKSDKIVFPIDIENIGGEER